jgi:hypothetical protein
MWAYVFLKTNEKELHMIYLTLNFYFIIGTP